MACGWRQSPDLALKKLDSVGPLSLAAGFQEKDFKENYD